eukprot:52227-Amorphochlora_amoeboformis.AAC.1
MSGAPSRFGLIKVFSSLSIPVVAVTTRLKLTEGHGWSSCTGEFRNGETPNRAGKIHITEQISIFTVILARYPKNHRDAEYKIRSTKHPKQGNREGGTPPSVL